MLPISDALAADLQIWNDEYEEIAWHHMDGVATEADEIAAQALDARGRALARQLAREMPMTEVVFWSLGDDDEPILEVVLGD